MHDQKWVNQLHQTAVPLLARFKIDEVWIMSPDQTKLQYREVGPPLVAVVHAKNINAVKGLSKKNMWKGLSVFTTTVSDCARPKNLNKPLNYQQLKNEKYMARVPNTLPDNLPDAEDGHGTADSIWAPCDIASAAIRTS